jgi:hypothetical protein
VAVKNLSVIRNLPVHHPYVVDELAEIERVLERDRAGAGSGLWGPIKTIFRSRAYMKRLAIAISLFAWQNGTGIDAISERLVSFHLPFMFDSESLIDF